MIEWSRHAWEKRTRRSSVKKIHGSSHAFIMQRSIGIKGFGFLITPQNTRLQLGLLSRINFPLGIECYFGAQEVLSLVRYVLSRTNDLFYKCIYSEEIWKNLTHKVLGPQFTSEWDEIIGCLTDQNRGKVQRFFLGYVFQVFLFGSERNRRRHGENSYTAVLDQID